MPPPEERVEYPYQNIRTKNFPWGDGDKTLLYVLYIIILTLLFHYICSKNKYEKRSLTFPPFTTCSWNDKVNYHNKDKVK